MLEDPRPEASAVVGHGTVLHGASEHHHVSSLPLHLQRVRVEILSVVRILRDLVRAWSDGGSSILLAELMFVRPRHTRAVHLSPEVSDEGDELDGERRRGVHDVWVAGRVECPVVRVVQVGQLPALARQDGVGRQTGDLRGLAQHDVADVEYDGVLGHLLEYPALVEEGPDQPVVLVVLLVPGPVLGPLTPRLVDLVRLVVVVDDPPGGLDVLLRVHLLQLVPSRTLEVSG